MDALLHIDALVEEKRVAYFAALDAERWWRPSTWRLCDEAREEWFNATAMAMPLWLAESELPFPVE